MPSCSARRPERARRPACRRPCSIGRCRATARSSSSSRGGSPHGPARGGSPSSATCHLGGEVGYQVRFDRCMARQTRIQVVTEGILLRMLQDDPFLERVAAVVFDEFHERSLNSDLALAMVRRVQETVRPELKIVVMSATLEAEPIARWLGGCPTVESRGRLHPVEISYLEDLQHRPIAERTADAVTQILDRTPGDVLVFLPGVGEIRQTARRLEPLAAARNLAVLPLYGDLPAEKQDEVARGRSVRRKVVLSTNVAETSLTIEGVTAVVDTGLARSLSFDPRVGMDRLQLVPISQAAADQRGRPGRADAARRMPAALGRADAPPAARPPKSRKSAASILPGRCWNCVSGASATRRRFPGSRPRRPRRSQQADALLRLLGAIDADGQCHRDRPRNGPAAGQPAAGPHVAGRPAAGRAGGGGLGGGAVERARPVRPRRGYAALVCRVPAAGSGRRFRFGCSRPRGGAGGVRGLGPRRFGRLDESIAARRSSCCTSAISCSANCGNVSSRSVCRVPAAHGVCRIRSSEHVAPTKPCAGHY